MPYVVLEGLPAAGKSETLELLARFFPQRVSVLSELVKEISMREAIDLFSDRQRLTQTLLAEVPRRRVAIDEAVASGKLCLEESHLGVHLAYAKALGDRSFIDAYPTIERTLPVPDAYLRLEIPIAVSLRRQRARRTPQFEVDGPTLERMLSHLDAWHTANGTEVVAIDADRRPSVFLDDIETILELRYAGDQAAAGETFDVLLLLGRPASGKSEFIDFMERCQRTRRSARYHLAPFCVIDDFRFLWEKFEEDDLWETLGRPRLYSRPDAGNYAVTDEGVWAFLIGKINAQAERLLAEAGTDSYRSLIIEFSRGERHGYAEALRHLSPQVLSRAVILYVSVSFEESRRRNLARYDAAKRDGILTHSVPGEEMERTYCRDDWERLVSSINEDGFIIVNGVRIPFTTMHNEPESTVPEVLDERYATALDRLYTLWRNRRVH